jgi:hypothetical protein
MSVISIVVNARRASLAISAVSYTIFAEVSSIHSTFAGLYAA